VLLDETLHFQESRQEKPFILENGLRYCK
jgi:hypothetical protein